ncbi:hypothetical protein EDB87DRAFT_1594218 [Lactarius vividus]|nr:hypothetical protein EDB87DRAFT_1594218 [Lactarius vividus]
MRTTCGACKSFFFDALASLQQPIMEPFNTPSKLDGGDHLTLLHIVRSQIPASKFASSPISDDARYLNTAMQHCRFRSVTGTMDGDLTECFCSPVFLLNGQGIASYTRNRQRRFATKKRASRELCKITECIQRIYFESTGRAPEGHRDLGSKIAAGSREV